ncbi:FMN-binding negative transcriptional regulator [Homoserinibacter sp. GY 40078]|uniref:FMN-binding negative transcriptional regulator n=1 Tax=Homoserinibacter sp. GY 40078 TaxID=2603275 RepID=UPI0011CB3BE0|nr:FMN-binding negative transcriptional regulator [Homoserinibacter sp. GY 40078]TXK18866.1 FMN-binding negative transcriptional regulator [Homoserinibacter sp. GY 40078]
MRENPGYALTDPQRVKDLIRRHPWATLASATDEGVVISHYPFLLDEVDDDLVLLSHVGRPDERLHRLGESEVAVVFSGPSGYISPSWYGVSPAVPTWNFATVHAYGTPEILSDEQNLAVLERLVDHFEDPLPHPFRMRGTLENAAYAERIVHGTVGFRMRVTRVVAKDKMSQDKPAEVVERILGELESSGPYANPALARWMREAR